jgi:Ricin-type beta-trefoil lectin domain/Putative Ig domain
MRTPTAVYRIRFEIVLACALFCLSALLATAAYAYASPAAASSAPLAAHKITVTNPGAQTTNPLSAHVDVAIKATDSDASATLTYTATGLPPGLAVSKTTGVISGTVTTAYTGTVKVTATDSTKVTGSASFTWAARNTIAITTPKAQLTTVGAAVALAVLAEDDDAKATPLKWTGSGLPTGLAIDSADGVITGSPTKAGSYTVTVKVSDPTKSTASVSFGWKIGDLITVAAPGSEASIVGFPITPVPVTATDSAPSQKLTFRAASTNRATGATAAGPPPGLAMSPSTGAITGTPTGDAAHYTVTVTATDSTGATGSAPIGWSVDNHITVTPPGARKFWARIPAQVKINATDSDPDQKLAYTAAGLPAGEAINAATGLISGTPTTISVGTATVTATDGAGSAGFVTFSWTVQLAITIPDPGTVRTTAGHALNVRLSFTDAAGRGDRVSLSAAGLPSGLIFEAGPATIYGWASAPGAYRVTINARGSLGDVSSMTFPLVVGAAPDSGPTGQIRLDLGGQCLDDLGNRPASGAAVVLWACRSGGPAERWTLASDGTVRIHGQCLEVAGNGGYLGQGVRLWTCDAGAAGPRETWLTGTDGQLASAASGLCLSDARSAAGNGTRPTLIGCGLRRGQLWTVPAERMLSALAGTCADDFHSSGVNGNVIDMYACNGTASQSWTAEPDGTLRMFGGKCLTVRGPIGALASRIELWSCLPRDRAQQWTVVRDRTLNSELRLDGVCLAVPSMTAPAASQLRTAPCSATDPRVHWHIW